MTTLSRRSTLASAAGLGLGYLADRWFGDPRRFHPVAGFGRLAAGLEQRTYADARRAGVTHTATLVGAAVALGLGLERMGRGRPGLTIALTAASTWAVLGGRSLDREASIIAGQLDRDDLPAARRQIRNLVGRDPTDLSVAEIARACVESVAENTSDAVIAPLFWGAVAGMPGLLGYRAVNTLDAMVGHRSPRYSRFGWASARVDDVANWLPARVSGALTIVAAGVVQGSWREAWEAVRRDAAQHPSPNAGVVEAAFAGALGVRLGGRNVYAGQVEERGTLGRGRAVEVADLDRAVRLSVVISAVSACLAVAGRAVRWRR